MDADRLLTPEQIDSYAAQAARFQEVNDRNGIPYEDEWNIPRMLLGALGRRNATLVTNRMVQILGDPEQRAIAEQNEQALHQPKQ